MFVLLELRIATTSRIKMKIIGSSQFFNGFGDSTRAESQVVYFHLNDTGQDTRQAQFHKNRIFIVELKAL